MQNSKRNIAIKSIVLFVIIIIPWIIVFIVTDKISKSNIADEIKIIDYKEDTLIKQADHKKFEILQQDFAGPEDVTAACITCHNERHKEIMNSSHWSWDREVVRENGETVRIGKHNIVNNFCIATNSNTWKCTSCHIGYGYKDKDFDFADAKKIDCIVCHDNTGTYEKQPLGSGYPVTKKKKFAKKTYFPPDYNYIAKNIGTPKNENCGVCHFYGGGGDNVKHGDLSSDLYHADKEMDVHMDEHGNAMSCVDCHDTERHKIPGKSFSVSNKKDDFSCQKCHELTPHKNITLNNHTNKLACQTCHIPVYAKGVSTNTYWDWSTAGRVDKMGEQIKEYDSIGNVSYKSGKGNYEWGTNLEPEYVWFNGKASNYVYGDVIEDTTVALQINELHGSYADGKSKIVPVKVHRGKQIFDPKNKMLIIPHVYGHSDSAYHHGLDWDISSKVGMEYAGLPYSGSYSFISTEMYWTINHMVAPAEQSVSCIECHARDSKLKDLTDFYLIGRDRSKLLDTLGIIFIILSFIGVFIHAGIRFMSRKKS